MESGHRVVCAWNILRYKQNFEEVIF